MSFKKVFVGLSFIAAALAAYDYLSAPAQGPALPRLSHIKQHVKESLLPSAAPESLSKPPVAYVARPSDVDYWVRRLSRLELPNSDEMRSETRLRPHQAPESLLRFAEELAPLVEEAQTSPEFAQSFYLFLEACSLDSRKAELPHSARALCFVNSLRLAQAHPQRFERRTLRLRRKLPEQVRVLAAALGPF